MSIKATLENYLKALLKGDRKEARTVIEDAFHVGMTANGVYVDVVWPIMVEIERLFRADKITVTQEHMATRINRTIVDQLQNKLPRKEARNKEIVVCCSESEMYELGAQITADLFESDGWNVKFVGGGLTNDDLLSFVNVAQPDALLIYGTKANQAPEIRSLIDRIKEVDARPDMKVIVSGGLFDRVEELWIEIGADMYAPNAQQAVENALMDHSNVGEQRTINRRKRKAVQKKQAAKMTV